MYVCVFVYFYDTIGAHNIEAYCSVLCICFDAYNNIFMRSHGSKEKSDYAIIIQKWVLFLTCILPNPAGVRQLPSIHLQNGTAPVPNKFTLSDSTVPWALPYPYSCSSFNRSNADVSGS